MKATGVACATCTTRCVLLRVLHDDQIIPRFRSRRWGLRETPLSENRPQLSFRSALLYSCSHEFPLLNTLQPPEPVTSFSEHSRMPTMCLASNEGQRVIQLCIASRGKGHRGLAERMLIASGSARFCVLVCSVAQSHLILCNPVDCSPLGSSVHGMSQARISEWDAVSFSRASSQPRDRTCISCVFRIGRRTLNHWATWEASYVSILLWWCLIFIPQTRHFFFFGCTMKLGNLSYPFRDQNAESPAGEAWNLNHWMAREVPRPILLHHCQVYLTLLYFSASLWANLI